MDLTPLKVVSIVLSHHGIAMCTVGELVLNYYNVPRVCHDLEICVTKASPATSAGLLCFTGLFEMDNLVSDFNNFTEYKRGFPRLRTTKWCLPQTLIIFTAAFFGLDPLRDVLTLPMDTRNVHISKEMMVNLEDIPGMHFPKLAPLIKGMAKKFLDTHDDIAMMAVEQLVDGMDLDETWVVDYLGDADTAVLDLVLDQVRGKPSRIDYFTDNKVSCFIADQEEAEKVRQIPGCH